MKRIHAPVPLSVAISTLAGMAAFWLNSLPLLALLVVAAMAYGLSVVTASLVVHYERRSAASPPDEQEPLDRNVIALILMFTLFGYTVTATFLSGVLRLLSMVSDYLSFLASPWIVVAIMFISGWFVFPTISIEYKAVDHEEQ